MDASDLARRARDKLAAALREAEDLEARAAEARIRAKAYRELLDGDASNNGSSPQSSVFLTAGEMKPDSYASKTKSLLEGRGKPAHLDEIVRGIGLELSTRTKGRVSSQLNKYVRGGRVFTRPSPGVYGLTEWSAR